MKIFIGSDHAGYELKEQLKAYLSELSYIVEDMGASVYNADDDYPDFVKPLAEKVAHDAKSRGIFIGGTGQGEAICANRTAGIRAALFYGTVLPKQVVDIAGRQSSDPYEIVRLARMHNDANILSLSARFLLLGEAKEAVRVFLETGFEADERHARRIGKIDA